MNVSKDPAGSAVGSVTTGTKSKIRELAIQDS
jgi:hypothetical protein